jgi:hypothetical protein
MLINLYKIIIKKEINLVMIIKKSKKILKLIEYIYKVGRIEIYDQKNNLYSYKKKKKRR